MGLNKLGGGATNPGKMRACLGGVTGEKVLTGHIFQWRNCSKTIMQSWPGKSVECQ